MSLNGLDAPDVLEASQAASVEPAGWFVLKYVTRDSVALLGRGKGGVAEARNVIAQYTDPSPLYGLIMYRRRKILIKYLPEGTSRLLQDVLERYSPYETLLEIATSEDLNDTALASSFPLHSTSQSVASNRLREISEDGEEVGQTAKPEIRQTASQKYQERRAEQVRASSERQERAQPAIQVNTSGSMIAGARSPATTLSSPNKSASSRSYLIREDGGNRSISSIRSSSIASTTDYATSTTSGKDSDSTSTVGRDLSQSTSPFVGTVTSSPRSDSTDTATVDRRLQPKDLPSIGGLRTAGESIESSADRPSGQIRRSTTEPLDFDEDDPYGINKLLKPKVKLGPRPVAAGDRTKRMTAAGVASIPATYKPQPPKKVPASTTLPPDPNAPSFTYSASMNSLPVPPPIPNTPDYDPRPISRGSIKSLPSHKSNPMTPDKIRLMKAVELRKKKLRKSQALEALSLPGEGSVASLSPTVSSVPKVMEEVREEPEEPQSNEVPAEIEDAGISSRLKDSAIDMNITKSSAIEDAVDQPIPDAPVANQEVDISTVASSANGAIATTSAAPETDEALAEDEPRAKTPSFLVEEPELEATHPPIVEQSFLWVDDGPSSDVPTPTEAPAGGGTGELMLPVDLNMQNESDSEMMLPIQESTPPSETVMLNEDVPPPSEVATVVPEPDAADSIVELPNGEQDSEDVAIPPSTARDTHVNRDVAVEAERQDEPAPSDEAADATPGDPETSDAKVPAHESIELPTIVTPDMPAEPEHISPSTPASPAASKSPTQANNMSPSIDTESPKSENFDSPTHSPPKRNSNFAKRRLGLAEPLKGLEDAEPELSSDDDLMDALDVAIFEDARSITVSTVSKSPSATFFARRPSATSAISETPSFRTIPSEQVASAVPHDRMADSPPRNSPSPTAAPRTGLLASIWTPQQDKPEAVTSIRRNVSTGISKRIQALAEQTSRESSFDLPSRDRPTSTKPLKTGFNKGHSRDPTHEGLIVTNGFQPSYSTPFNNSRSEAVLHRDSVSVSTRIVRQSSDEQTDTEAKADTNYRPAPLILDSSPSSAQATSPIHDDLPSPAESRTSSNSASSTARHHIEALVKTTSSSYRQSLSRRRTQTPVSSPTPEESPLPPPTRSTTDSVLSEASNEDGAVSSNRTSRTSRFFKRMSNFGGKRPITSPQSPSRGASTSSISPGRRMPVAKEEPSGPPAVVIGNLNVQFPDTLLWKRRILSIDDAGNLVLSVPQAMEHQKSAARRFHLTEFRQPYIPDLDRQELPNSVMLDFVDGTTLQAACEDSPTQRQVIGTLRSYWKAWTAA